jgi:hypothetical protein
MSPVASSNLDTGSEWRHIQNLLLLTARATRQPTRLIRYVTVDVNVLKRVIHTQIFFVIYRNTKRLLSSRIRTTPLRLLRTIRVNDFSLFSAVLFHCWLQNWGYSTAASYFSAPSYASPSYKAEAESHYATTATPLLATIPQLVITTRVLPISLTQQLLLTTMLHRIMELNPTITSTSPSQRVLIIQRQLLPLMATGTKSMVTIPLLLATHMDLLPSPKL